MGTLTTANYSYSSGREATDAFTEGFLSTPDGILRVFKQESSDNLDERLVAERGFGMFSARGSETSNPTDLTGGGEGHNKLVTLTEYLCQYVLSNRNFKRMKPESRGALLEQQGLSAGYTLEYAAATLVANGFASTTTADSAYLFSDTHNVIGSGTDDNKGTTGLSYASYWAAVAMMKKVEMSEGLVQAFTPKYLIVPPELEQTAIQIVGSAVTDADQQITGVAGIEVIVCNLFDDANDWMLFAEPGWPGCPTAFIGEDMTARYYGTDVNANLTHQYTMSMEFGLGAAGWRGCFGASVT